MFGGVNGITLAFGATLLGEAVDYPSFLFTQTQPGERPADARRRVGPVLRLAVLTTACGALALLTSGFPGLIELGVLTVVGILVAGAVTWWVIPEWVPGDLGRRLPVLRWSRPIVVPLARPLRFVALAVLVGCVIAFDATRTVFDDDLAHLNPLPAQLALRDRELRDALGAPDVRSLVMIRGSTEDDVLARAERLRPVLADAVAAGLASGFDLVSDYLPSAATQARRRAALPPPQTLHADLAAAVAGTPFRLETFAPFEADVERARTAAPLTARDLAGTALGLRTSALLGRDADGVYAVVPLRGVADAAALRARVAGVNDAAIAWIDLREEATSLLHRYRQQALISTAFGIALIYVVLGAGLRDARRALVVVAPVVLATLLAAALLVAAGVLLTIFHVVALLLVIGTGVNYALFAERAMQEPDEAGRTVRTLLVVSGTTLCAFATLAWSSIPVLRALGTTVCAGVLATLAVVAFTMLPTRAEAAR
jgi:predicted exporter